MDLFEKSAARSTNGTSASPTLQLLIQDDGRGILPDTPLGFGLTAMRERVTHLAAHAGFKARRAKAPSCG